MNSIKCPNCGLINFATATDCKRCKQSLEARAYPYWQGNNAADPPKPDWSKLQTVPALDADTVDFDGTHTVGNILFAIYLGLNAVLLLSAVYFFSTAQMHEVLRLVSDQQSKVYLSSFGTLYNMVIFGVIIFLPASVMLFVRLCQKAESFLSWVVIYLVAELVYSLIQVAVVFSLAQDLRSKHIPQFDAASDTTYGIIGLNVISILITFVWFRYFTSSKRARMVFELCVAAPSNSDSM